MKIHIKDLDSDQHIYMGTLMSLMKLFTFFPFEYVTTPWKKFGIRCWEAFVLWSCILLCVQCVVELCIMEDALAGRHIINTGAYISAVVVLFYYRGRRALLLQVIDTMKKFRYSSHESVEVVTMEKYIRVMNMVNVVWGVSVISLSLVICPFYVAVSSERTLPIAAYYPYDPLKSPIYEATVAYQSVMNMILGSTYGITDLSMTSMIVVAVAQFKVLECNLQNLVYSALVKCKCDPELVREFASNFNNQYAPQEERVPEAIRAALGTEEFVRALEGYMGECVEQHNLLLEYCKDIESFCNPVLFMKVMGSFYQLIFVTYSVMSETENSMGVAIVQAMYFICVVVELVMYCIAGEMLLVETANIERAIYEFPWYICPKKVKKAVLIMQLRCSKPPKITAGKVMNISMETLMKIVKTSVSYYTVLAATLE